MIMTQLCYFDCCDLLNIGKSFNHMQQHSGYLNFIYAMKQHVFKMPLGLIWITCFEMALAQTKKQK